MRQQLLGTADAPNTIEKIKTIFGTTEHAHINAARRIVYDPRLKNDIAWANKVLKKLAE